MNDTIKALHRHLDAHPEEHGCRLALADALREAGSPLADGYHALGMNQKYPIESKYGIFFFSTGKCISTEENLPHGILPGSWIEKACPHRPGMQWGPDVTGDWGSPKSRQECEDYMAAVFLKLPKRERLKWLAGKMIDGVV